MEILIYADLHIHNHHKQIVNSETALSFLRYIKEYSLSNNIKKMIFAGDFFHTKSRAYAPHVIQSMLKIKDIYKAGITHYMIIGNHDLANPHNTMNSILFTFSDYATVVPDYKFIDIDDNRFHFLSYATTPFTDFIFSEKKKNVLIAHLDIVGFEMTNGVECRDGYKIDQLSKFDLIISGHYHRRQTKGKITYVGNCFQTNFGESKYDNGFMVLETNDLSYRFIEYPEAPRYATYEINKKSELKNIIPTNNFIRIKLKVGGLDISEIKQNLYRDGALTVEVIDYEDIKEIENFSMSMVDSPEDLALSYLKDSTIPSRIKPEEAMQFFKKIEEFANNITDYEV